MKRYILIAVVVLAVLLIFYFVWDMFIKSPDPVKLGDKIKDTTAIVDNDSTGRPDTTSQHAVIKANEDTMWVEYTIKSGDILSVVADKFNTTKSRLMKKNNMTEDKTTKGKKLWVPVKATHEVASGETVDKIALNYKANKDDILKANGLKKASDLQSGKTIYIPY